jgi:hypothetical protein
MKNFDIYLKFFPKAELPTIITEEMHHDFAQENKPIPNELVEEFIIKFEAEEPDEYTEYLPCLQLPLEEKKFHAIVYWKATLLQYDYIIATYTKTGVMIDKKPIAGMRLNGKAIEHTVASIDPLLNIYSAAGMATNKDNYDANSTKASQLEILDNGMIE